MSARAVHTYQNVYRGANVLITGGAGFIGSHLARTLASLGAHVRVLDDMSGGHERNLQGPSTPGTIELRRASILDAQELASAIAGCRFAFHHLLFMVSSS